MTKLAGKRVRISIAEPFEHGRAGSEVRGCVTGQVRSSTGLLLLIASEAGTMLIAPRHADTTLEDLSSGRLTVHVARTSTEIKDGDVIRDRDIENIGSGVAQLDDDARSSPSNLGSGR
ncbi:MAG: hypothetical protein IT386_08790 [Deltaproteobacteria bacterium]|nr:hypothetical protein [Deltaproteobacteria bacterium]